jgi:hypothetical protein
MDLKIERHGKHQLDQWAINEAREWFLAPHSIVTTRIMLMAKGLTEEQASATVSYVWDQYAELNTAGNVTLAQIAEQYWQICKHAKQKGAFTAAIKALEKLGEVNGAEKSELTDDEFSGMTDDQLREYVETGRMPDLEKSVLM